MKRNILIILIFAFVISAPAMAQYDPNYRMNQNKVTTYSSKVEKFSRMKRTGIGLGVGGALLTGAGVALISSAEWETTTNNYGGQTTTTSDSEGLGGLLMVIAGIPLTATGVVLGIIGNNKAKSYQSKLEGLSINMLYTPDKRGLALSYRF